MVNLKEFVDEFVKEKSELADTSKIETDLKRSIKQQNETIKKLTEDNQNLVIEQEDIKNKIKPMIKISKISNIDEKIANLFSDFGTFKDEIKQINKENNKRKVQDDKIYGDLQLWITTAETSIDGLKNQQKQLLIEQKKCLNEEDVERLIHDETGCIKKSIERCNKEYASTQRLVDQLRHTCETVRNESAKNRVMIDKLDQLAVDPIVFAEIERRFEKIEKCCKEVTNSIDEIKEENIKNLKDAIDSMATQLVHSETRSRELVERNRKDIAGHELQSSERMQSIIRQIAGSDLKNSEEIDKIKKYIKNILSEEDIKNKIVFEDIKEEKYRIEDYIGYEEGQFDENIDNFGLLKIIPPRTVIWQIPQAQNLFKKYCRGKALESPRFDVQGVSGAVIRFFPKGSKASKSSNPQGSMCSVYLRCPAGPKVAFRFMIGAFKSSLMESKFDHPSDKGRHDMCDLWSNLEYDGSLIVALEFADDYSLTDPCHTDFN
eukprot:GHVL01004405.1.p1 GENE.GHVL01004405.1~~GHVL01004405.1.p1  ORF type:complete len:490 (+),score=147.54 GHVL01004405.1:426-1895(+)